MLVCLLLVLDELRCPCPRSPTVVMWKAGAEARPGWRIGRDLWQLSIDDWAVP